MGALQSKLGPESLQSQPLYGNWCTAYVATGSLRFELCTAMAPPALVTIDGVNMSHSTCFTARMIVVFMIACRRQLMTYAEHRAYRHVLVLLRSNQEYRKMY
eukprot:jgi/Ulvmu1/2357/UM013_0205.1